MRRLVVFLTMALTLACLPVIVHADSDVAYTKEWIENVSVNVVTANLNSPEVHVSPAIARFGIGTSEGFGSMVGRIQPTAAITGTYFCTKSLTPVGDIVVGGEYVYSGCVGTGLCFTPDNKVVFKKTDRAHRNNWDGYDSVVCTGPRLVDGGTAYVSPWSEGFHDSSIMRKATRSALGVTKDNKLLLVTVNKPIYLSHLARIMRELGAVDALCLDGGSSTALYCKGRAYSHPGRKLTNLIVIYETSDKFAKAKDSLAPSAVVASKPTRS